MDKWIHINMWKCKLWKYFTTFHFVVWTGRTDLLPLDGAKRCLAERRPRDVGLDSVSYTFVPALSSRSGPKVSTQFVMTHVVQKQF